MLNRGGGVINHFTFIDGEHTDEACFADFISMYEEMPEGGVCGFHDTNLTTTGIECISSFLKYKERPFTFLVFNNSVVSAFFLDVEPEEIPANLISQAINWENFKQSSRNDLLVENVKNRCEFNIGLKPVSVHRAY